MTKQVKDTAPVQPEAHNSTPPRNVYASVKTFDAEGKTIGERIVDMHHIGTRDFLAKHLYWSTHKGHCTEINVATPGDIAAYLEKGRQELAAKLNNTPIEAVAA